MEKDMQKLAALEGEGFYTTTYEVVNDDSSTTEVRTTYIAGNATVPVTDDDEYWANAYVGTARGAGVDFSGSTRNITVALGHDSDVSIADIVAQGGTAFESIAAVRGSYGNSEIYGSSAAETLYAGMGDSTIYGAGGRDVLYNDGGNEKYGSATFFFGVGDGKDTIYGFQEREENDATKADVLFLDPSAEDIEYRIVGDNLRISYNSSDQLTIVEGANDILQINSDGVNTDVVAIGSELDYQRFVNHYIGLGNSAQVTVDDLVDGGDINIWMNLGTWARENGVEGFEEFGVYEDIKVLDARGFYEGATLVGGYETDNEIYAGRGTNSLWGGNGGDDTLYAGVGMSQYFYLNGDGTDVIEGAKNDEVVNLLNIGLEEFDFEGGPLSYDSDHIKLNFADGGSLDVKSSADVVFEIKDGSQWKLDRTANTLNYQGGRREE